MYICICICGTKYLIGIIEINTSGIRITKSSHNVEKLRKTCIGILVLRNNINMKKLLHARGNWIMYDRLPIVMYLYLNTLSNDMSITIILILTGL